VAFRGASGVAAMVEMRMSKKTTVQVGLIQRPIEGFPDRLYRALQPAAGETLGRDLGQFERPRQQILRRGSLPKIIPRRQRLLRGKPLRLAEDHHTQGPPPTTCACSSPIGSSAVTWPTLTWVVDKSLAPPLSLAITMSLSAT